MTGTVLSLKNVDKFYGPIGHGVHAVRDVSMDFTKGEIVALLGSSGCGKTSTLRMIAGFEEVSRGSIVLAGRDIGRLPPAKRNVAMAFEGYSLYPPLTVRDNISFALKSSSLTAGEIETRVGEISDMLEIGDILDRFPSSISGGQQQRASLGRALVRDADLHLLDEPMGQLEPQLRALLRGRIKHFIKERGLTAILVTHDQTEANALADRIAVMEDGVLQQFDSPDILRDKPSNLFTGTFVGEPPMNVFAAEVSADNGIISLRFEGEMSLQYEAGSFSGDVCEAMLSRRNVMIGVRPYAVRRSKKKGIRTKVAVNQWLGDQSHIATEFAGAMLVLVEHDRAEVKPGDDIHIDLEPSSLHIFDSASGAAIAHGTELAS